MKCMVLYFTILLLIFVKISNRLDTKFEEKTAIFLFFQISENNGGRENEISHQVEDISHD